MAVPVVVVAEPNETWLPVHRDRLRALVDEHGAVMVRGLGLTDHAAAAAAIRRLLADLIVERESFAPRVGHGAGLYGATAWPSEQPMCMHHELSYALRVPRLIAFCCLAAPDSGGVTALADGVAVLRDLPAQLVEKFSRSGWQLLRSHNDVVGVPWQEAFGVEHRDGVADYCRTNDIEWYWDANGGLRTRRARPAVIRHPVSGERVWCNQVAFLNEWTMEPAVREYLVDAFGAAGLPFNTRFGDGTPITRETVDLINDVYAAHTVREPWFAGDLMIVDNLRMAHSRDPYTGSREVVVAMGEPVGLTPAVR